MNELVKSDCIEETLDVFLLPKPAGNPTGDSIRHHMQHHVHNQPGHPGVFMDHVGFREQQYSPHCQHRPIHKYVKHQGEHVLAFVVRHPSGLTTEIAKPVKEKQPDQNVVGIDVLEDWDEVFHFSGSFGK